MDIALVLSFTDNATYDWYEYEILPMIGDFFTILRVILLPVLYENYYNNSCNFCGISPYVT